MGSRPGPPSLYQRPLFTTFPSAPFEPPDKENDHLIPAPNENYAEFPDPSFARNRVQKRSMSDVSNVDRPGKRTRLGEETIEHLPDPSEMTIVEDEGTKPPHSYASLIGMAILRAPHRRLTLAQIYKWISDTYSFYRGEETGWQNSIRHNLSLNKAFVKQERPKGDSGKGHYWTIAPGMEMQFVKERPSRKGTVVANLSVPPQKIRPEAPPSLIEALAPQKWLEPSSQRPSTAPAVAVRPPSAEVELPHPSSDATLPASDPALQEEHEQAARPPQSSPPRAINSSPPMPAPRTRRRETISPSRINQPSSSRGRKRIHPGMDDSGYFSSLESSALRPTKSAALLTSEMDESCPQKRNGGRAEEEIARIRSSSHDTTPSHLRFQISDVDALASSPVRARHQIADLGPVTPAVVFKKPVRPPPSLSPTAHLRFHRQQVQELAKSPSRGLGPSAADELVWSPYFKLSTSSGDVPSDFATTPCGTASSSPLKRSAKTLAAHHSLSTPTNAMLEIPGGSKRLNSKTPTRSSLLRASMKNTPSSVEKAADAALLKDTVDFLDFGVFDDENVAEPENGPDILQGFVKIGGGGGTMAGQSTSPSKKTPTARSSFLRSLTARF